MSALKLALDLLSLGISPIPVQFRSKSPVLPGWQKKRITKETAGEFFNDHPQNVGGLLGEPSDWKNDVDLDCDEAVELAPSFLPTTLQFGRDSRPRSHFIIRSENAEPLKFIFDGKTLLELRSTGQQTVFPGSTHPSGEVIHWENQETIADVPFEDLKRLLSRLAAAALMRRSGVAIPVAIEAAKKWHSKYEAGLSESGFKQIRLWLGIETPSSTASIPRRENTELDQAIANWNAAHPIHFERKSGGRCPVCDDHGSFGHLPDDDQRWYCFSTDHPDGVGVRGTQGFHGDSLDLEAHASGRTRIEVLRRDGFIGPAHIRPLRLVNDHDGPAADQPPPDLNVPPEAYSEESNVIDIDSYRRKTRNNSYLTAVQLIGEAAKEPVRGARGILEGKHLTFNEMTETQELGHKPIKDEDTSRIRSNIERMHAGGIDKGGDEVGLKLARQDIEHAIDEIAHQYSYHPVRDYLDSLVWDEIDRISSIPDDILNVTRSTINIAMVKRWLISAVRRVYQPGIKADCMLVLIGRQGAFKSTFFKIIAGERFYVDCGTGIDSKDVYLDIRQGWVVELGEMASIRSARDVETVKRFLSCSTDVYRPPYGRRTVRSPRSCIFGGTANPTDILTDATGARRFWTIESDFINREPLADQRDQIWAQAVALHRAGEQHWLTDEEERLLVEAQRPLAASDVWEEAVIGYVSGKSNVSVREVLIECLDFELGDCEHREQNRVASILKKNGWNKYMSGGYSRWRPGKQTGDSE